MDAFVGTSGWYYEWNKKKNLDWFVENSGLNSVELNASFYRFPFPGNVFGESALEIWENFRELFKPMDHLIDFYLFQAPPRFEEIERALKFAEKTGLGERFALEIRNKELLGNDELCGRFLNRVTLVSVDSPDYINRIFPGKTVYMRMHGRENWYSYNYSQEEIKETIEKITELEREKVYIYFNNNHKMLENFVFVLTCFCGSIVNPYYE
ncbi:Hypothetical protein MmTuc01_2957 [Methanosarcina mazei Tuc01]|uniref:DUF72 domain-containing protein n=1 Tax=Methanosarcina mazei Tuc01 TaxID=1236903 RepID=M1QMF5_METMZ|nr:DUF72 domain-containing protein [Methanosarcina mazei]AGF98229.1 Hypothetical protein MmTuc01_2957 [Methanosarcina mazei Tuc01]